MTARYKLVFSPVDRPRLFDLAEDPHELTNAFGEPERREAVRVLSRALRAYCADHGDRYGSTPEVAAELERAAG